MNIPIIIVDDNEGDRYLLSRTIEDSGIDCSIYEFEAGDEFLDIFLDTERFISLIGKNPNKPLVLLDINMPRMSGFEVLQGMASAQRQIDHIVILMVTSSNDEHDRKQATDYGFVTDFAVKPMDEETIQSLVANHYS